MVASLSPVAAAFVVSNSCLLSFCLSGGYVGRIRQGTVLKSVFLSARKNARVDRTEKELNRFLPEEEEQVFVHSIFCSLSHFHFSVKSYG